MAQRNRGINRRHDWPGLKAEFIAGVESVQAFVARKKLPYSDACKRAKIEGWREARAEVQAQALERAKEQSVGIHLSRYQKYLDMLEDARAHVQHLLKEGFGEDGRMLKSLDPDSVNKLIIAIERATKTERLIRGESTENVDSRNMHVDLVSWLESQKDGREKSDGEADNGQTG